MTARTVGNQQFGNLNLLQENLQLQMKTQDRGDSHF